MLPHLVMFKCIIEGIQSEPQHTGHACCPKCPHTQKKIKLVMNLHLGIRVFHAVYECLSKSHTSQRVH